MQFSGLRKKSAKEILRAIAKLMGGKKVNEPPREPHILSKISSFQKIQ